MRYSVLMSVYYKETSSNLIQSLDSIFKQTIEPHEVILVKDGKLTKELEFVIKEYINKYKNFYVYELEKNSGLGVALNYGLKYCSNEIVVRMDTDDISVPDRVEKQLKYLSENQDVSVLGSYVEEFIDVVDKTMYMKCVPLGDKKIKNMFKTKNAMNHPSVIFKKSDVLSVGGYIELKLNEDYFLWVRMAQKGYVFANINEPLVKMRINNNTYLRRGGFSYFKIQNLIYKYLKDEKYLSKKEYISGYLLRFVFRVLLPNRVRKHVYILLLRKGI